MMTSSPARRLLAATLIAAMCAPATALAQTPEDDAGDSAIGDSGTGTPQGDGAKPWADGVTPEDQQAATSLFKEGNAFLRDSNYNDAIARYREAVGHWDHPAIHYNMALALLNAGQPLEIYASLEAALRWGPAALGPEQFELAERYKKLVEQQLVRVTVTCSQQGAKVFVDGKESHACPGQQEHLLRAGEHSFTAQAPGYETTAVSKVYPGGQTETVELKLYRVDELTRYRRRFATWLPWTIGGVGAVVTAVGALLHVSAISDIDEYDTAIRECGGCMPDAELRDLESGAETKQAIAIGAYVAGGAALITGIALLVINRPQPYRVDAEERPPGAAIVPVVTPDGAGVAATFRF